MFILHSYRTNPIFRVRVPPAAHETDGDRSGVETAVLEKTADNRMSDNP
jgi:hypothetical protein